MKHHPSFWGELLVVLEESLTAFSGVSPDLIDAPTAIPKTCRRDSSKIGSSVQTSAQCTRRRNPEARSKQSIEGGEERWRTRCS
jgi:hypothetical protein